MTIHRRQTGATLLVSLIMLVVLTLLAISAINTSTTNLKIVGNSQFRNDAIGAAQAAINLVLSSGGYLTDPVSAPDTMEVDVNGDGDTDETVEIVQPCLLYSRAILVGELSPTNAEDVKCLASSVAQNAGLMGQNTGAEESNCANVTWRLRAEVDNAVTGANVALVQGASMRMDRILADAYKNDSTKRCSN